MRLLDKLFGGRSGPDMTACYTRIVAIAREPHWYRAGGAPDTLDGRFDMVALILSLVMLRLEHDGAHGRLASVRLTERFVDDMDGQIREIGFGDMVVGKQIGRVMSLLGGRLGAYRDGVTDTALIRNLWRGNAPSVGHLTHVRGQAQGFATRIGGRSLADIIAGDFA